MKEPLFSEISQVALVVPDLEKAARVVTRELGVGPLLQLRFGAVEGDPAFAQNAVVLPVEGYYLRGEYVGSYGIYMAAVTFGNNIQLELISPSENRSLFREYLETHGPGVQHICIQHHRDYDGYLRLLGEMAVAGNPLVSVCRVDGEELCAFVGHDQRLGLSFELQYRPETYHLPDLPPPVIPADRTCNAVPLADALTGLTLAVWKMEPVIKLLEQQYGIGPWEITGPGFHGVQDGIYTWIRTAVCKALNLRLELFEPVHPKDKSDEVVRFLQKNGGNGVFSIHFTAPEGVEILKSKRRVLFGNEHACLLDFTNELGAYLKFADPIYEG